MLKEIRTVRFVALSLLFAMAAAVYASDYNTLSTKANRFFDQKDWASASAMFTVMLSEQPSDVQTYGKAIVAAGMQKQPEEQMRLFDYAVAYHVPFDSLFAQVEKTSIAMGRADMYEHFLFLLKENKPWLDRNLDGCLMKYYAFRRNPEGMIEYSRKMLAGLPDDTGYMLVLAQGLLLKGDYDAAMGEYERIAALDPRNYEALLYLGNYYKDRVATDASARVKAVEYLSRAREIRQTPYVDGALRELGAL